MRGKLAAALEQSGFPTDDAERVAHWDPYDQNASADWFDPKYMFSITDGFDMWRSETRPMSNYRRMAAN